MASAKTVDSDADNIGSLFKDIDDMDSELFGRKKDVVLRRGLSNIDDVFGDPQKGKKSRKNIDFFSTKKPTVSFLDELSDVELQQREQREISRKKKMSDHPPSINSVPTVTTAGDHPTRVVKRTATNMEETFRQALRRGASIRTGETTESSFVTGTVLSEGAEEEPFYGSNRFESVSQKNPTTNPLVEIPEYNRIRRLENEIGRLNREIDSLKSKQMEREEALVEEWKEKLKRRDRQHEEELADLEEIQRKQVNRLKNDHEALFQSLRDIFQKQIETIIEGQRESKNYEGMLKKVDELIVRIGEVTTNFNNQADKNNADQNHYISVREQQLDVREARIKKEEEWLADEKRQIRELNMKLQSLYDSSEQNSIQERWQIRKEREKLNAEKEAFKREQLKILDTSEKQKAEMESSKSNFLREQHDLVVRVMAAKSSLEAEKSAFDVQRDRDVLRLKMEAEQLDYKLKQVQNADDILQNTQRIYEQKYQQLVTLERALVDECFELERCRRQMETIQNDTQKMSNTRSEQLQPTIPNGIQAFRETSGPDLITDPYTDGRPNRREKESYDAILRMHASTLESTASCQNLNTHA